MAASVYTTLISKVDEYGFQRPKGFDYIAYDKFMSEYVSILVRRARRWDQYLGKSKDVFKLKRCTKLERFVHKGVPMSLRGDVWMLISGAKAKRDKDPTLYSTLLAQRVKVNPTIEQINLDIPRTFPTNIFFRGNDPKGLEQPLFNVLLAFANHNSRIGYCQGMNYVAGLLLLVTRDEDKSFWLMKTLIEDILPDYYSSNLSGFMVDMKVMTSLIGEHCPKVHKHMTKHEIPWELICSKWFICLFCDILPIETVFRIWDCLMYNGSTVIVRVALLTVIIHIDEILGTNDFAELATNFKSFSTSKKMFHCHEFIEKLLDTKFLNLTPSEIKDLREKYNCEVQMELEERNKR